MPLYKVTLFFESFKFGWTESYQLDVASIDVAKQKADDLVPLRGKIVAPGAGLVQYKVSSLLFPEILGPFRVSEKDQNNDVLGQTDRPYSALLARLTATLPGVRPTFRWIRGVPDGLIQQIASDPSGFIQNGDWDRAWNPFALEMQNLTWGWFGKNKAVIPPVGVFTAIKKIQITKAVRRDTGRPFDLPRGRQPNRAAAAALRRLRSTPAVVPSISSGAATPPS